MNKTAATIHWKERMEDADEQRECERRITERAAALLREFPELLHMEITLAPDGAAFAATVHAAGKGVETATHADGAAPQQAAKRALDKLRQQLRRAHDKRIFKRRRQTPPPAVPPAPAD